MTGSHQVTLDQPFALALPDESLPQLSQLGLLLPDGRLLQSTCSADGVMPRKVPIHIIVAMFKTAMTGSPVKPVMPVDQHSTRPGKPYRTYSLFAGICEMLCERDMDCRAFN